jgi:hypothetical protein
MHSGFYYLSIVREFFSAILQRERNLAAVGQHDSLVSFEMFRNKQTALIVQVMEVLAFRECISQMMKVTTRATQSKDNNKETGTIEETIVALSVAVVVLATTGCIGHRGCSSSCAIFCIPVIHHHNNKGKYVKIVP